MPLIKGIDQPVRDFLADLPRVASAGICMVCDPRGIPDVLSNKRYAYMCLPDSPTGFTFLRVDLESRSGAPLAAPPAAVAGAYNTAIMAAEFVPLGTATELVPCIYVIVALTAAPWNQLMEYNIRTDVWTVLTAIPGMAAALNTSIDLVGTSGSMGIFDALGPNIRNRFLYISGDNTGGGGVGNLGGVVGTFSNIDQYNIVTNAHVLLTGAAGARGAAAGAGSKIVWGPNYPERLLSNRGGPSAVMDYYNLNGAAADAWVATAPEPRINLDEGTELVTLYEAPGWLAVRPGGNSNQIYGIEVGGLGYQNVCSIDDSPLPAAHASNALVAWWIAGGYYFGAIPYGRSVCKRIQVPMPL
jgi:hypothetical protein